MNRIADYALIGDCHSAALVGRDAGTVAEAGAKLERYVESQFPQGVRVERGLVSGEELLG